MFDPESIDELKGAIIECIDGDSGVLDSAPSPQPPLAAPSMLDTYHHMGAGFTRGMDRVFQVVTEYNLSEQPRRALALLDSGSYSEVSCKG
ncbi:MAG: hypothetical protein ACOX87_11495 [Chloroflexota bacterium]|jgi:hypothetical protein